MIVIMTKILQKKLMKIKIFNNIKVKGQILNLLIIKLVQKGSVIIIILYN